MGWLISVSGLDGAGKSTLIYALKDKFEDHGQPVRVMTVRLGFTPLILWVKDLAGAEESDLPSAEKSDTPKKPSPLKQITRHLYRLFSLVDLFGFSIWIAISRAAGDQMITDRYYWDNQIIYRDKYGPPGWLARALMHLSRRVAGEPDAAFMLTLPVEESYRRTLIRNQGLEEEPIELLERRAKIYAKLDEPYLIEIDATQPVGQVLGSVWIKLESILEKS